MANLNAVGICGYVCTLQFVSDIYNNTTVGDITKELIKVSICLDPHSDLSLWYRVRNITYSVFKIPEIIDKCIDQSIMPGPLRILKAALVQKVVFRRKMSYALATASVNEAVTQIFKPQNSLAIFCKTAEKECYWTTLGVNTIVAYPVNSYIDKFIDKTLKQLGYD